MVVGVEAIFQVVVVGVAEVAMSSEPGSLCSPIVLLEWQLEIVRNSYRHQNVLGTQACALVLSFAG
jgi:hypothetical protein